MSGVAGIVILFTILYTTYAEDSITPTGLSGDISIGALLPLTGDLSSQGDGDEAAIELAVYDFNEYLKSDTDWRLKVVYEDSGTDPEIVLEKVKSLHTKNIDLIVGPTSSAELQNIREYVDSNNILIFSQSSTAPSLAIPGDNIFRLTPDDSKQGPVLVDFINDNGIQVIIQLVRDDTWGNELSTIIKESFVKEGQDKSVIIIKYNSHSPEFSVVTLQLEKAVRDQIEIHGKENVGIVVIGFAEVLKFMQLSTEYEILDDVRWFGTDGSTLDNKISSDLIGSKFAEKVQFTSTLLKIPENDIRNDVEERIVSKIGKIPKSYAYSAYDIVWILGLAIEQTASTDVDKIVPIIYDVTSNYEGAVGNVQLNDAGDLQVSHYDFWQIIDSSWKMIEHVGH